MSDRELIQKAAGLAADRLAQLITDAGPIYMSAMDMVQDLIEQAIDEAYTTRLEADSIEFIDLDA
tara:strand:- start:196 stop:390 length:195 start_codon:yes stop_codon:yes gene_type:complete